jgi:hypothetical protein
MEWVKIPDTLIRLTRMTINTTQAKVKLDNKVSATFEFNTGVKQGDGLSAALFIVALHSVIKSIDEREQFIRNQVKYVHMQMISLQ